MKRSIILFILADYVRLHMLQSITFLTSSSKALIMKPSTWMEASPRFSTWISSVVTTLQFCRDCFTQYRDMKAMDPIELLGILPACHFGKFCSKKYLAIVHPKMESSLFGNLEQHQQVIAGSHPRSQFYGEFLGWPRPFGCFTCWPSHSTLHRVNLRLVGELSFIPNIWKVL